MLTLPGGFEIPVGLEITEFSGYDLVKKPLPEETAQALLIEQLERGETPEKLYLRVSKKLGDYRVELMAVAY